MCYVLVKLTLYYLVNIQCNPGLGKLRWRLIFAILGCAGMSIIYGLKVNLHANIVAMVNNTALKIEAAKEHVDKGDEATVSDGSHGDGLNYTVCYGIGSPGYDPDAEENKEMEGAKQGPQVV